MNILEGNKLIAEFLDINKGRPNFPYVTRKGTWKAEGLKYHKSFDWLMDVVEKVESIKDPHHGHFGVHIVSNSCTIQATNFRPDQPIADHPHYFAHHVFESKIIATWTALVEFINWYNSQKK